MLDWFVPTPGYQSVLLSVLLSGPCSPGLGYVQEVFQQILGKGRIWTRANVGLLCLRYEDLAESVEEYVLDMLRDQLNRRQPMDNVSRNLLRLLTATCGYKEVRLMAVQRLEMWLQNPKVRVLVAFSPDPQGCNDTVPSLEARPVGPGISDFVCDSGWLLTLSGLIV